MADTALKNLTEAVIEGEEDLAAQAAGEALSAGIPAEEILNTISDSGDETRKIVRNG